MRRILVATFTSLDGVMQAPGGPQEDPTGGFTLGGWTAPHFDQALGASLGEIFGRPFDLLLGRKTYEIFAGYWPRQPDSDPFAAKLNRLPKYVASTTLTDPAWSNTTVLEGDVPAAVAELKRRPGRELQVHGSGELAATLLRNGLVDELRIWIHPVVIARGKRLFDDDSAMAAFELVDLKRTEKGVVILVYRPAGAPEFGSMGDIA
jgi:dihydrofolate reductase